MKRANKLDNRISFFTAMIALICMYGIFFNDSWACDHVGNYYGLGKWAWGIEGYVPVTLAGGRFGAFIWDTLSFLFAQIGVSKLQHEWVLQVVFMVLLALAAKTLYSIFEKYFDIKYKPVIVTLIICIAFINPLFVENVVFVGYELGASILCGAVAAKLFTNRTVRSSILAVALLFISIITYQAHISLFFVWTTAYIYLEYGKKLSKNAFIELIRSYAIALVPLITDMAVMKIFAAYSQRGDDLTTGESASLIKSIVRIWYHLYVTEIDLTVRCFVLLFTVVLVGIGIVVFAKERRTGRMGEVAYLLVVFAVLNCYYVAIVFVGYASFYGRVFWPGFAAISMMCLLGLHLCQKSLAKKVYLYIAGVFFIGLFFFTQTECSDCYIANKLDEEIAGIVEDYIQHYEAETGYSIETINVKILDDFERYQKYLIRNSKYEFAYKMLTQETLPVDLINYVYGENYDKKKMSDEDYEKYFSDIAGKEALVVTDFNPAQQLVFEGDSLYWVVY